MCVFLTLKWLIIGYQRPLMSTLCPPFATYLLVQDVPACSLAYVEEDATLFGFDRDDVCVEV